MEGTIWREGTDEYRLEPLTEEKVQKAEKELGVKLPDSYINLLKEQNGGYIHHDAHPASTPNSWADDHVSVEYIMGIGEENGILESGYYIEEWDLPAGVVLISGDGHSWIALDYRSTKENPPVIFIDPDQDQIFELAPDFGTFLSQLTSWEDDTAEDEIRESPKKGIWSRLFGK